MDIKPKLLPHGDRAADIVFENEISPEINGRVAALYRTVIESKPDGVVSCIPAYRTLTVEYDPMRITYGQLCLFLRGIMETKPVNAEGKLVRIPVLYGGEQGPDLELVAQNAGLSAVEVVKRHTAPKYHVYMIGFMPGFPYLGGLDPTIACPRKTTPRLRVEGGSVGIAGMQTGIYPEPSPGGRNIIGRTPLKLFDEEKLSMLSTGDRVGFVQIDKATYDKIVVTGEWDA
ncbi:MAG: 5-oxoprolinase subunit PxpB [Clostridia bacterium]|nr:5-oxoprolinase subunit PxpB [Clostridia bacterium]